MPVELKEAADGNMDSVLNELEKLNTMEVKVGFFSSGDSQLLMIATVHEFGISITVTEKMRGWLGVHGLHLKKDTTQINIPERSFIRTGIDEWAKRTGPKILRNGIDAILQGEGTAAQLGERLGIGMAGAVKAMIKKVKEPPLHPFSTQRRVASVKSKKAKQKAASNPNPLMGRGRMRQAVTYKVSFKKAAVAAAA